MISSQLGGLANGHDRLKIWVKDNRPCAKLKQYCQQHGVSYIDAQPGLGFGENNNLLFQTIHETSGFLAADSFIVMNPDISIAAATILDLVKRMQDEHCQIATLNLYRDHALSEPDANIRRFPNLRSLAWMSVMRSVSEPYDKSTMNENCEVDWASGAFLAFDAAHYAALQGFDTRYFMYFEDVDICYRSRHLLGQAVRYYPALKATHLAAHRNRNLFSRHAYWFFGSFMTFLSLRYLSYDRRATPTPAE